MFKKVFALLFLSTIHMAFSFSVIGQVAEKLEMRASIGGIQSRVRHIGQLITEDQSEIKGKGNKSLTGGIKIGLHVHENWALTTGLRFNRQKYAFNLNNKINDPFGYTFQIKDEVLSGDLSALLQYTYNFNMFNKTPSILFSLGPVLSYRNERNFSYLSQIDISEEPPYAAAFTTVEQWLPTTIASGLEAGVHFSPSINSRFLIGVTHYYQLTNNENYRYYAKIDYYETKNGAILNSDKIEGIFGFKTGFWIVSLDYYLFKSSYDHKANRRKRKTPRYNLED